MYHEGYQNSDPKSTGSSIMALCDFCNCDSAFYRQAGEEIRVGGRWVDTYSWNMAVVVFGLSRCAMAAVCRGMWTI